jgi:hypothetical protein
LAFRFSTMAQADCEMISDDDNNSPDTLNRGRSPDNNGTHQDKNPASKVREWTLLVKATTSGDANVNIVKLHK